MSKRKNRILITVAVLVIGFAAVAEYAFEPLRSMADIIQWVLVAALLLGAREAIARLDRSESKLRALVGSLDELILILDRDGRYIDVPATNPLLLFRPVEQVIGRRIHDIFPKEQADAFLAEIHRALRSERPTSLDYVLTINGKEVWFNASVTRLDGVTVMWVARDITERKNAEIELEKRVAERTRALQRSEARYRTVFEQTDEIIFTLSPDGIITSLNPAFERVLGWSCDQWVGKPFAGLVPAEAAADCVRLFDILQRKGRLDLVRVIALHKSGSRVSLEMTARQKVADGEFPGFVGVVRDVTRRDLDEAKLRDSERQLAEAQALAKIGSFDHNLTTHTLLWSEQLYRMFDMEPSSDTLPESAFIDMVIEDDRPKIAEVQRIVATRGEHEWEMRLRAADGTIRTTRCHGKLVVDTAGATTRLLGAVRDITEERRAEELLKQSEERFRLATQATTEAMWDLDVATGRSWHGDGYQQFGYEAEEIAEGVAWWLDRVHPEDRNRVKEIRDEAWHTGQPLWSAEYRIRRADGTYAQVFHRALILRDAQKKPVRVVGALLDITERRQLVDQLEQAKRVSSLGRVAASIAHEFN
ncbi:MAG TPA: PAS domain S-box protein, partial [Thermoanaerobaculia bacterium]|nr:PAS domain S-box protein [Thermoanaerobaculia bacterium]